MIRMLRRLCVVLALFFALPSPMAYAQASGLLPDAFRAVATGQPGLLPEIDASSPAAVLRSFREETQRIEGLYAAYEADPRSATLLAMARSFFRLGSALFDLSEVPPATRIKTGNAAVGYLADILLRLPPIPPESIPGGVPGPSENLPSHWTIPGTEIRMVRRTEGPNAGDYVFSAATLDRLADFHRQAMVLPPLQPGLVASWSQAQRREVGPLLKALNLDDLPAPLQRELLGTPLWKVAVAALVVFAVIAITLAWRRRVHRWTRRMQGWRRIALWLTVPLVLAALIIAGQVFLTWQVILSDGMANLETMLATIGLYLAAAWATWCLCWMIAEMAIATPGLPEDVYDANLIRIVARVISLLAAGGLLIYGANDVGVPALGLLAGVSLGGIALALAAQSTVENLFGGIVILTDRPFRVGDQIRFGGAAGIVEAIGPRSTRIRGADGTLTTVPNADLAKTQLINVSARVTSLFQHRLTLPVGLSSTSVEALLAELRRRVSAHPLVEVGPDQPRIRLVAVGEGQTQIEIFARITTTDLPEFLAAQEALLLDILRSAEACGLDLSLPVPAVITGSPGGLAAPADSV